MNFAQMLMTEVKPLPDTREGKREKRVRREKRGDAGEPRELKGREKYLAAIGKEWTKTVDIGRRLNMDRTSFFARLQEYHRRGLIERRPVGGQDYNNHFGWEWRVK